MADKSLATKVVKDKVIATLMRAEHGLKQAVTIHQAKVVADVAAAQQVFATRQRLGEDVIGYAHQIKIHALARLGDLLKEMPKATGVVGRSKRGMTRGSSGVPRVVEPPTYADIGLSKKTAAVAQQLASLPEATREAIAKREQTIAQARRERTAETIRKAVELPDAKYRVVYADPPWKYNDKADEGSVQAGGAARHYPTMSIADLCAMPVAGFCEPNAVLFLWVTSPLLFEAKAVIDSWGFTYKASFVWDKVKHNLGHYNSVRHEFLLVCTRGSCVPDSKKLVDSVQSIERTTHSTKPDEFRSIIETLYSRGKRIELFARKMVDGWDSYGYEA